ncbi:type VI secretion system-associated protein [Marinobacter sp. EhC06]|jgi:type VI secretion system protein VasI|uniref:type VI secretion system-associated protein VasI n=1 Tax=Marinobacter TaxID=2742 RepID=UPI0007D92798|nr:MULTISPECIES: type VI secretion system-associated protein VasI [unclassified Marinobacter]OAN88613.1 type VI secretion system-associated protein [Marinobacter sp. EhN04]OAN91595.1 type VI secretion system-associated protein [Marinobacter sp. EhC06]
MIPRRVRLTDGVAAALALVSLVSNACAGQLEDARLCTSEPQRLERLACFDEVFGTPLAASGKELAAPDARRSERWRQAYASLDAENAGAGVLYRNTGRAAGQLVTVPALGIQPPRPLLALQCHNNITELTLMLPEAMDEERVQLGFGRGQTVWRVRDNGFVLSGGRGLPAIRTVKAMIDGTEARIDSPNSRIDGLLFDLSGYRRAIEPLRETCGW